MGRHSLTDFIGTSATRIRSSGKLATHRFKVEGCCRANVDVTTGAASPLFHFGEVGALVPVGLRIVLVRDSVEPRYICGLASDDIVRHADDRGGVHASAQFGKDWVVRTESALHRFCEDETEVLFIFRVGLVMDSPVRIEIPIFAACVRSASY